MGHPSVERDADAIQPYGQSLSRAHTHRCPRTLLRSRHTHTGSPSFTLAGHLHRPTPSSSNAPKALQAAWDGVGVGRRRPQRIPDAHASRRGGDPMRPGHTQRGTRDEGTRKDTRGTRWGPSWGPSLTPAARPASSSSSSGGSNSPRAPGAWVAVSTRCPCAVPRRGGPGFMAAFVRGAGCAGPALGSSAAGSASLVRSLARGSAPTAAAPAGSVAAAAATAAAPRAGGASRRAGPRRHRHATPPPASVSPRAGGGGRGALTSAPLLWIREARRVRAAGEPALPDSTPGLSAPSRVVSEDPDSGDRKSVV